MFGVALAAAVRSIVLASASLAPPPALDSLAAALAPHKAVVECGGGGTCGPNSLGFALAHARLHDGSGDDVRRQRKMSSRVRGCLPETRYMFMPIGSESKPCCTYFISLMKMAVVRQRRGDIAGPGEAA